MKYLIIVWAVMWVLIWAGVALACEPEDLAGTYQTFSVVHANGTVATASCRLKIDMDGALQAGTHCRTFYGKNKTDRYSIHGGELTIHDTCEIIGFVQFKRDRTKIWAWLSQNHQVISGRGRSGATIMTFQGVRISP